MKTLHTRTDACMQSVTEQYITSVYWGMTTLTTVGFGDFAPVSAQRGDTGALLEML